MTLSLCASLLHAAAADNTHTAPQLLKFCFGQTASLIIPGAKTLSAAEKKK